MTRIPIADPIIGEAERRRVTDVLESGRLADGPVVRSFEAAFAEYCGTTHGVATSNGTTALQTALVALGHGAGATVLTTPFSFVATANAIRLAGATPIFADIDPETFNLDPDAVETILRERGGAIDAIVVVHLYGCPARMDRLTELAEQYDCSLIEDAAQAHGAAFEGSRVGSLADAGCFSFYPTKNMTTGEGGMVVTDRGSVAERAASYVNHGRIGPDEYGGLGHNFRLPSIAAAIGLAQLDRLPGFLERRRENAALLTDALSGIPGLEVPTAPPDCRHAYHQYTIRVADRDELARFLDQAGVDSGVYYPRPIHETGGYEDVDVRAPEAERAASEVLSLPVHPGVDVADATVVADVVQEFFAVSGEPAGHHRQL